MRKIQIYEQTDEAKEQIMQERQRQNSLKIAALKNVKAVDDPNELIEDMAQYLSEIGADNSYIDKEVMRARGISNDPWVHITRGVIGRETM